MDAREQRPHERNDRIGIVVGADHDARGARVGGRVPPCLVHGQVDVADAGQAGPVEEGRDVGDEADDLPFAAVAQAETLSDGGLAAERHAGERLADDGNAGAPGPVRLRQEPPVAQAEPHDLGVAGIDRAHPGPLLVGAARPRAAGDLEGLHRMSRIEWRAGRQRRRGHAGQVRQAGHLAPQRPGGLQDGGVALLDLVGVETAAAESDRGAGRADRDPDPHDVGRVEPPIQGDERHEAPQQQPRAGQEDHRERDLRHREPRLPAVRPRASEAAAGGPVPRVEGAGQVDARPREGRRGPEEQPGRHRQAGRERERDAVQGDVGEAGDAPRHQGRRGAHDPDRHRAADGAAGHAQEHALGQQLADDPSSARAEGAADRELAPPGDAAREEQAGHVGAGHQQHQPGRGREHGQGGPERAPQLFPQADHSPLGWRAQLRPGSLGPLAVDDRPDLRQRLVRRHAGPQAADSQHESGVLERPVGRRLVGRDDQRRPESGRGAGRLETLGQHPDHGVRRVTDIDGGADRVGVRSEPIRPRTVAQERDRRRAFLRVRRGEEPAEVRRRPQQREVGRGDGLAREVAVRPGPSDGEARRGG